MVRRAPTRVQSLYDNALATLRAQSSLAPPADFDSETRLWHFLADHGLALEAGWEMQRLERHYDDRSGGLLALLGASVARGAHERLVRLAYRLSQQVLESGPRDGDRDAAVSGAVRSVARGQCVATRACRTRCSWV